MGVKHRFLYLVDQYERETFGLSFAETDHPAYVEIVAMGEKAVPWLLERVLKWGGLDWTLALRTLTGANPVRKKDQGRVHAMERAWLRWGHKHGHIRVVQKRKSAKG